MTRLGGGEGQKEVWSITRDPFNVHTPFRRMKEVLLSPGDELGSALALPEGESSERWGGLRVSCDCTKEKETQG